MQVKEPIAKKIKDAIQQLVVAAEGGDFEAIAWLLLTEEIELSPEQVASIEKGLYKIVSTELDVGTVPRLKALSLYMQCAGRF